MSVNDVNMEITDDEEAQNAIENALGDLDDADGFIDDKDSIQAVEMIDAAIEKLNSVRKYLEGKSE